MKKIYDLLIQTYGPQGWWPIWHEKPEKRYRKKSYTHPQNEKERLEICIGTILAQNTSWKNAEKAVENLAKQGYFDHVRKLAQIKKQKLAPLIRSAGYFNQKAERIITFARYVEKKHGNVTKMLKQTPHHLRVELLTLNGIGPETADSIILYGQKQPTFISDAYARRILARVNGWKKEPTYEELQKKILIQDSPFKKATYVEANELHAALVEHAKRFCTKNKPRCENCPLLNSSCVFGKKTENQK